MFKKNKWEKEARELKQLIKTDLFIIFDNFVELEERIDNIEAVICELNDVCLGKKYGKKKKTKTK